MITKSEIATMLTDSGLTQPITDASEWTLDGLAAELADFVAYAEASPRERAVAKACIRAIEAELARRVAQLEDAYLEGGW